MSPRRRCALIAGTALATLLMGAIGFNSTRWVGTTFPGFFVMANRVVPPVARSAWGPAAARVFHHQVDAVDGVPVDTAAAVYREVARHAPGTPIRYSVRAEDGAPATAVIRCRRFSWSDYALMFGSHLLTGSMLIAAALLAGCLRVHTSVYMALLSACAALGVLALTTADAYGPYWFVRVHVLARAMLPAGFIHLALVCSRPRRGGLRNPWLVGAYLGVLLMALGFEVVLYWPSAYVTMRLASSVAQGLCAVVIMAALIADRCATPAPPVVGAVTACVALTLLIGAPVNGAALAACIVLPLVVTFVISGRGAQAHRSSRGEMPTAVAPGVTSAFGLATALRRRVDRLDRRIGGRLPQAAAALAGLLAVAFISISAVHSTAWLGSTFPGFFVMQNGVIPSIAVGDWATDVSGLFQHQILEVDGRPLENGAAAYEHSAHRPPGDLIKYTLRRPDGTIVVRSVRSRRFSGADYMSVFGAFLLTGSAFLLAGLAVFAWRPHSAACQAFLSAGVVGGVFVLTATDLYGPYWFFRVHVIAEALVPASLVHLALAFPANRLRRGRPLLSAAYAVCVLLAGIYELVLYWPAAYSAVHLVASIAQAIGGTMLIGVIAYDLATTPSVVVRRRILVAAAGTIAAFLLPTLLMGTSGMSAGRVPVNAAALTGFLFPFSFAYAIGKRDLLKVDVALVRAVVVLAAIGTTAYSGAVHRLAELAARLH